MEIIGLDDFNLTEEDLAKSLSEVPMKVSVYARYYPELEILKPLNPKQRGQAISKHLRALYKELVLKWPSENFELKGTKIKPRGIIGILTGKQITELLKLNLIDWVFISGIPNYKKIEKDEEQFFSVKALFAVDIEGFDYSDSVQLLEERILLVKALNHQEAAEKLKPEFDAYEKEYLNSDKRFVRWRFVEIQDIYEVGVSEINPNGTEIFSVLKRQKLKNAITNYSV